MDHSPVSWAHPNPESGYVSQSCQQYRPNPEAVPLGGLWRSRVVGSFSRVEERRLESNLRMSEVFAGGGRRLMCAP